MSAKADWNVHHIGTKAAQAEDSLAVSDDDDSDVGLWPVTEQLVDSATVGWMI